MLTFQQIASRAYDMVGSPNDSVTQANIKQDINQALKLFKNAARRYWTRKQVTANLVNAQQDYEMPADFVRTTEVTITANGIVYPLTEVPSEHKWNELNIIPAVTIYIPTMFFMKGFNTISIWPAPSTSNVGTLNVSYEPNLPDYTLSDVTGTTGSVTNGSVTVTDSNASFTASLVNAWFSVTDGTGGNWYQIAAVPNATTLTLAQYYQDQTNATATYIVGAAPDIPPDYQMGLMYYACYQFYLKRKDEGNANQFLSLFQNLLDQYQETYASKTTGVVFTKQAGDVYNIFNIPPTGLS